MPFACAEFPLRRQKTRLNPKFLPSNRWRQLSVVLTRRYAVAPLVKKHRPAGLEVLKGDQISAKNFSPGVRQFKAMCPEGHRNPARHIGSKSFACLFILAPLPGRILAWRVLRVETLGSALFHFGAQTLYPSLRLTRMWRPARRLPGNRRT